LDPKRPKHARNHAQDLRGASKLAVDATRGITRLVEDMHRTIASGPWVLGRPLEGPARFLTELVYGSIDGVAQAVGAGLELALSELAPHLGDSAPGPQREAIVAALNGVLGDYLAESGNPLAIEMQLRRGGHALELEREALRASIPQATGKVLVLVHGSSMCDRQWLWKGHEHGEALARELGYTPVYLAYNSGLHISTNGRSFSELLDALVGAWPVPIEELVLLGHSMGGLVSRSACHVAESAGHAWRAQLDAMICLGSPHHGAPLERGGNWIDILLGVSAYSAPLARLGKIRSAGVTDLRFGNVLDEHWQGRDRFAFSFEPDARRTLSLPEGVACYAIAGTTALEPRASLPGDGLVPVDSALGRHPKRELTLAFPEAHRSIAFGTGHLDLLSAPAVYETLRAWLASGTEA
jgi:pimeloyl-ACP methyl ester carboxylesterase